MTLTPLAAGSLGHSLIGPATLSGISLILGFALVLGLRGNKRVRLDGQDRLGIFSLVTGTIWSAAGGSWADFMSDVHSVPQGMLGAGSPIGNPGKGVVAILLLMSTFLPDWDKKPRRFPPIFFGLTGASVLADAGGIWATAVNIVRVIASAITGGA
ncbi:hypothetical protein ACFRDV_22145 [Streptomyces fagopyri]|uniref:hypothetical protein n=1 Tax=Streptomyces fagopyri TaxID=2662397 RepID=UPI00367D4E89